jgi:hypothetical protein
MTFPLERRRFSRITVSLPVTYHTGRSHTSEPFQGQGILRDISLSGTYFHVDPKIYFKPGQILSLTISAPLPYLENTDISHLHASGEVVRFDPPAPNRPQAGVALTFLGCLNFCPSPPANVLNL